MQTLSRTLHDLMLAMLLLSWVAPVAASNSARVLDYDLTVAIDPARGQLQASLRIDLAEDPQEVLEFVLHAALDLEPGAGVARLERTGRQRGAVPLARYRVLPEPGAAHLELRWHGTIRHALEARGEGYGKRFEATPGMISPQGVYLSAAAGWFPRVDEALYRFRLAVTLPQGWDAVSQGRPVEAEVGAGAEVVWLSRWPQDDIYLIAAPFTRYQRDTGGVLAQAFLRRPDPGLAARYLDATERYVALYSRLFGPYPYAKFALVENFWESGYGMPSFTLIGSRVLRLPFILTSSYPHEVLHNWWGNGVFVDYRGGNWSEGLTAYLSDHLFQEQAGRGAAYRRDVLQRYRDFVAADPAAGQAAGQAAGRDFPLVEFTGRHGPVSQAVGYGKAMMVLHMLRRRLGDAVFLAGLRRFYADNRFRYATWADLRRAMEQAAGEPLEAYFAQWLLRKGAPRLTLSGASVERVGESTTTWRLRGTLGQVASGGPWRLRVPLLVQLAAESASGAAVDEASTWQRRVVTLSTASRSFDLAFERQPLRLRVDPGFDLFRLLDAAEVPPALSGLFGSPDPLVILPATASADQRAAWRRMVAGWGAGDADWQVIADDAVETLPRDRSVLLLGRGNRFRDRVSRRDRVTADDERTAVIVERHPEHAGRVLVWIGGGAIEYRPALGRKLPHYGKYGYLGFQGPRNRVKGQWPASESPLWVDLVDEAPPLLPLPEESPLTDLLDHQLTVVPGQR